MVKISGVADFKKKIASITSDAGKKKLASALYAAGNAIQVDAQISITTGAVSGKGHVASLPGQPPNADTHFLADQIETHLIRADGSVIEVQVQSNAEYSAALEYGTARIAPRPFMAPALAKNRQEIADALGDAVNTIIRGESGGRPNDRPRGGSGNG